ncbi:MAG: diguanylate cyclase [Geitlerinemataceae cyanobacterium]
MPRHPTSLDNQFLTAAIDRQYCLLSGDLSVTEALRQFQQSEATIGIACSEVGTGPDSFWGVATECDLLRALCNADFSPRTTSETIATLPLIPALAVPQNAISSWEDLLAHRKIDPVAYPSFAARTSLARDAHYIILLDGDNQPCGTIGPDCWQSLDRWSLPALRDRLQRSRNASSTKHANNTESEREIDTQAYRLEVQRQQVLERLFSDIEASLSSSPGIEAALQIAADGLRELLDCDRVFVYGRDIYDRQGGSQDGHGQNDRSEGEQILAQAVADERWRLDRDVFEADDFADAAWRRPAPSGQLLACAGIETSVKAEVLSARDRQFLQQIDAQTVLTVDVLVADARWGTIVINDCESTRRDTQASYATSVLLAKRLAIRIGLELDHFQTFDRLEAELQERWRAEQQIRSLNEQLESRVEQRTHDLEAANQQLETALRENQLLMENARTSEVSVRAFFEAMTEIVMTIRADYEVISIAPTNPHLLYGPTTDVFDRTAGLFYDLDSASAIGSAIARVLETKCAQSLKYPLEVDGQQRWFRVRLSPNAEPDCITWVAQDITALENSEAARVETETRWSLLLDGVSDYGIFELALDGTIASWNTGAERIQGYTEAEVLGRPYAVLFDPETANSGQPTRELERARLDGRHVAESRHQHRSGRSIWTEIRISTLYDFQEAPCGFAVVMHDITEQRRVQYWQRMLERAIDACANGVIVSDATQSHNPIVYVNSGFETITGYSEYEAIGRNCRFLQNDDDDQLGLKVLRRSVREGTGCCVTLRNYRRDGTMFWNELTLSPVRDDSGSVTNYIGIVNDVTSSYESEMQLTTLNAKLQAVFDSTCDVAIISTAPDGQIQLANAGARTLLACFGPDDLQDLNFERFFFSSEIEQHYADMFPDAPIQERPANFECLTLCSAHEAALEAREWTLRRCDGKELRVGLEIEPIFKEGAHPLGFVAIVQDVTERSSMQLELEESKMLLASVLESSIDGIMAFRCIHDPNTQAIVDFQWIVANPAASWFVTSSDRNLVGKFFRKECSEAHVAELFDDYVRVVEGGGMLEREIYRAAEDRRGHWFQITAIELGDGLTVTLRDITKTKSIENVLQQTNQELETKIRVLNSRNRDMLKLGELNEYLQACETVREAYETVAARMMSLLPGCAGTLYQIQDSDRLVQIATWGEPNINEIGGLKQDCWALRRSRTHLMERGDNELFCKHIHACDCVEVSLCLPLSAQGTSLGLLHVWSSEPRALQEAQRQLAGAVSEQLALSIANLQLRESLEQQSTRDPLTGLFNRRYMEDALDRLLHAAHLHQKHLGLVMIDIDRFKSYNDHYGHVVGDLVLREVAQAVSSVLRQSDIACRYGGEELIAIVPDAPANAVYQRAEQIRQRIADLELSHAGNSLDSVTASFGVASFPECGSDRRALMRVADDALYRAKDDGRNCVRVAQAIADRIDRNTEGSS